MDLESQPAVYQYPISTSQKVCAAPIKPGGPGQTDNEHTAKGIRYNVRAPHNYDATRAHGLIVVYAPAGTSATQTERLMAFTRQATSAGFIVAYADHATLGPAAARELATIPREVGEKWCVDSSRIFLTGHSDGGSIAHIAAGILRGPVGVRGIAPSAAGIVANDLQAVGCHQPLRALIMHSKNDDLFPGFGAQAAKWWAQCNRCDVARTQKLPNGCIAYRDCAKGTPTWYCEGTGRHTTWPNQNATIIEFFSKAIH